LNIAIILAGYFAFIWLYALALDKRGESVTPYLIAMMLVCTIGSFYTYGTQSLFAFIAYFCGFSFRFPRNIGMLVILLVVIILNAFFITPKMSYFYLGSATLLSVGLFAFGWMEQRERIFRRKEAQSETQIEQLAAIAERERIARDLHDVLGHSLSSIALKAELASKLADAGQFEKVKREANEVAALARALLNETREAVSGLKNIGLAAEIEKSRALLRDKAIELQVTTDMVTLDAQQETALSMVLREATTNLIRHSNAKHVQVRLNHINDVTCLMIEDDGECQKLQFGNGLNGIKERIERLSGRFEIQSNPNVILTVYLPKR
jgi:two-component system sensor histidine kinase DesK